MRRGGALRSTSINCETAITPSLDQGFVNGVVECTEIWWHRAVQSEFLRRGRKRAAQSQKAQISRSVEPWIW